MIDYIVDDPKTLRKICDVDRIMARLDAYEAERGDNGVGVAQIVNPSLGGSYQIVSERLAKILLARKDLLAERIVEYATTFYPRSYFERIKKSLNS